MAASNPSPPRPRTRRPLYRHGSVMVATRPLPYDGGIKAGEVVDGRLRTWMRRRLYQRGFIGPEGHPWTEAAIAGYRRRTRGQATARVVGDHEIENAAAHASEQTPLELRHVGGPKFEIVKGDVVLETVSGKANAQARLDEMQGGAG